MLSTSSCVGLQTFGTFDTKAIKQSEPAISLDTLKEPKMSKPIHLFLFLLFSFSFTLISAEGPEILYAPEVDSPLGVRNPKGPEGLSQYDFIIGDWDVDITLFREGTEPFSYKAKWHNTWIANGYVVMQEWRGPYSTGIELRLYDEKENIWIGQNSYLPSPGTWYSNSAEFVNGEMIVTTRMEVAGGKMQITREIYHDIKPDSFKVRNERSIDNGKTWLKGGYVAIAKKL